MCASEEYPVSRHGIEPGGAHTEVAVGAEKSPEVVTLDDQQIVASLLRHGGLP
jgi:hypothetical protein